MEDRPESGHRSLLTASGRKEYRKLQMIEDYFMIPKEIYNKRSFQYSRRYAIQFIEEQSQGCDALIPYMAMSYYDRLGGEYQDPADGEGNLKQVIEETRKKNNLFLLCCLFIAWKMKADDFNLSNFLQMRNFEYTTKEVLDMEYDISQRLNWRLGTLTPFEFAEYMIPVLITIPTDPSPRRAVCQLIARSQFDAVFLQFRPSILATAAVSVVSSEMFPRSHVIFQHQILTTEFVAPYLVMLFKCQRLLKPLFIHPADTTTPIDSSQAHLPGPSSEAAAPSFPAEAEQQQQQQCRHLGKEPALSSEIQTAAGDDAEVDPLNWTMDFELGWRHAQEDADKLPGEGICYATALVGRILECCCSSNDLIRPASRCHIM